METEVFKSLTHNSDSGSIDDDDLPVWHGSGSLNERENDVLQVQVTMY